MKKMIFWLCALMLVPALAIADGDGVSISAAESANAKLFGRLV